MTVYSSLGVNRSTILAPDTQPVGPFHIANHAPGFAADTGYFFDLPTGAAGNLSYNNASGVSQWSVALSHINAACDKWCGFMLDATDALLYGVAVDENTSPDTYYTFSVNSAGTVTNIGNAQPSTDFSIQAAWASAGHLQREADGSGNLTLRSGNSLTLQEMVINISTGAIVSDPTGLSGFYSTSSMSATRKTSNGVLVSIANGSLRLVGSNGAFLYGVTNPANLGIQYITGSNLDALQWNGKVYLASSSTSLMSGYGARQFTTTEFDTRFERIARDLGLTHN